MRLARTHRSSGCLLRIVFLVRALGSWSVELPWSARRRRCGRRIVARGRRRGAGAPRPAPPARTPPPGSAAASAPASAAGSLGRSAAATAWAARLVGVATGVGAGVDVGVGASARPLLARLRPLAARPRAGATRSARARRSDRRSAVTQYVVPPPIARQPVIGGGGRAGPHARQRRRVERAGVGGGGVLLDAREPFAGTMDRPVDHPWPLADRRLRAVAEPAPAQRSGASSAGRGQSAQPPEAGRVQLADVARQVAQLRMCGRSSSSASALAVPPTSAASVGAKRSHSSPASISA